MSAPFQFDLVSPEAILVSKPVVSVVIPGTMGDFGVLADHAPLLSSVRPGVVRVSYEDGSNDNIYVAGGFADVKDNLCTILAEQAVDVSDLNKEELANLIQDLEAQCKNCEGLEEEHYIRKQLEQAVAKLDACHVYHV
jgi:F-type H+-transporting ATPase subunit epsilon